MTTVYDMDYAMAMEEADKVSETFTHLAHVFFEYGITEEVDGSYHFEEMLGMFEACRYDTELEIASLCAICKSLLHELVEASDGFDKAERKAYWLARFSEIESLKEACNG